MYLLDSDVFIQAKNLHYGFDIVPAFWHWLVTSHAAGRLFTVERVAQEVIAGGDDLADWMRARPASFILKPTADDAPALQRVSVWANSAGYRQGAAATFLSSGDYYLVGQALSLGYTIVTHEVASPAGEKRIKIPDACRAVRVPSMSPFQMLRAEGARF